MTPEDLARLTEEERAIAVRLEKAAPGRWFPWNAYPCGGGSHPKDESCVHVSRLGPAEAAARLGIVADGGQGDMNGHRDDFLFVCAASSDVALLLTRLAQARAVVEAARPISAKYVMRGDGQLYVIVDGEHWTDEQMRALIVAVAAHDAEVRP